MFGPVSSYVVEAEDGASVIEFAFDGQELHQRRIPLTTAADTADGKDGGAGLSMPD